MGCCAAWVSEWVERASERDEKDWNNSMWGGHAWYGCLYLHPVIPISLSTALGIHVYIPYSITWLHASSHPSAAQPPKPHPTYCSAAACLPGSENETKWRSSISAQLSYPTLLFSRVAHHPRETHFIQVSPTQIERENSHIYLYLCFIQHNIYEPWNTMDPRVSSFWLGWHWKQFPRFWIMFSPSR